MANTKVTKAVLANDAVGLDQLDISNDPSDGQALTYDGNSTNLQWATISGTTINNNADNRVITGSGTANTLNGESNLVFDGTNLGVGTSSPVAPVTINDKATFSFNVNDAVYGNNLYYDGAGNDRWERLSGNAGGAYYQTAGTHIWYATSAGGATGDAVTPTELVRIQSGGGISFNGDSAAANALDDYEEGTWTPTYSSDVGLGTVDGITGASGEYVKIGQYVHLFGKFTMNGSSGTRIEKGDCIRLTGLPFVLNDRKSSGTVYTTRAFTNKGGFTGAAYWYASSYAVIQFLGQGSTVWSGDENETVYFSINFRKSS